MPQRLDHWWEVDEDSDVQKLAQAVRAVWWDYGKPWLERCSDMNQAAIWLASRQQFFLAAMTSLAAGDKSSSSAYLAEALADWPEGQDRIEAWRKQHLS